MVTNIFYIPGLGDRYDGFRSRAVKSWRLWGVRAKHIPIIWYDGKDMPSKLAKISTAIDAVPDGERVVLIGESAGATLALAFATDRRVSRIITLCGVARPDTPVSQYLRRKAPALDQGVGVLSDSFTADIHCVRAAVDGVVGKKYSIVKGATEHVIWSVGHLTTIALCLTVLSPIISAIAKK